MRVATAYFYLHPYHYNKKQLTVLHLFVYVFLLRLFNVSLEYNY